MSTNMRKRVTAAVASLALALPLAGFAAVGPAGAAPKAPKKKGPAVVKIVMSAPSGVAGHLRLDGPTKIALDKAADDKSERARYEVRPGRYRIKATSTVVAGVEYAPVVKKATVKVGKGKTVKVRVRWKKVVEAARLEVVQATADQVALRWTSRKGKKFMLRRAAGEVAPASASRGDKVALTKSREHTDTGLAGGTRYSYSLFVQTKVKAKGRKGRSGKGKAKKKVAWVGPVSVTTGTEGVDPVTSTPTPDYALLPGAFVVDPGDTDVVTVVDGQIWLTLASSRPAPVLGAGVALPISAALPDGFAGKIAEIAPTGRQVRVVQAGLTEIFSRYDLAVPIDAVMTRTRTTPAGSRAASAAPRAFSKGAVGTEGASSCLGYSTDLSVSVDPTMRAAGHFYFGIDSFWGVPHTARLDLGAELTMGASMDLEASKSLTCLLGIDDYLLRVTTVPVPMALKYSAGLTVGATGTLKVRDLGFETTTSLASKASLGLTNSAESDLKHTGRLLEPTGEGAVEANLAIGGSFTFGPGTGVKEAGAIAGISGSLDLAKLSVNGAWGELESGEDSCLTLGLGGGVSASLSAEAWVGPLAASASWKLWEDTWNYMDPRTWPTGCDTPEDPELGRGEVQATLEWDNNDDMDLHVIDPSGEEIYYANDSSASGGNLDVDDIPGCSAPTAGNQNVENIFWPQDVAPSGTYKVFVQEYNDCSADNGQWALTVRVDGRVVVRKVGIGTSPQFEFAVR